MPDEVLRVVVDGHEFARDRIVAIEGEDLGGVLRVRYIETDVRCSMRKEGLRPATATEIAIARAAYSAVQRAAHNDRAAHLREADFLKGQIEKAMGWYREMAEACEALKTPIPMRLPCPDCSELHVDVGEFATKVHHTHACQHCGMVWRPAVAATVGVLFLPGFRNGEQSK